MVCAVSWGKTRLWDSNNGNLCVNVRVWERNSVLSKTSDLNIIHFWKSYEQARLWDIDSVRVWECEGARVLPQNNGMQMSYDECR